MHMSVQLKAISRENMRAFRFAGLTIAVMFERVNAPDVSTMAYLTITTRGIIDKAQSP